MNVKEDILLKIAALVRKHGGELAVPARTLHLPEGLRLDGPVNSEAAPFITGLSPARACGPPGPASLLHASASGKGVHRPQTGGAQPSQPACSYRFVVALPFYVFVQLSEMDRRSSGSAI